MVTRVGGLRRFDRRRVTVTMSPADPQRAAQAPGLAPGARLVLRPVDLQLLAASDVRSRAGEQPHDWVEAGVTGAHPWVTIACKFSDFALEPRTLSYFTGMYGSASPGLDHYWRELSYDTVNLAGSMAYGWFELPSPRNAYVYDMDGNGSVDADLDALFTDCTAAATASVDFPAFQGINMVFNADLDGPAWGGSRYATLDGVAKVWRVTWVPPWAYADVSVTAHEMGHGFGLPHSSGSYGDDLRQRVGRDEQGSLRVSARGRHLRLHGAAHHHVSQGSARLDSVGAQGRRRVRRSGHRHARAPRAAHGHQSPDGLGVGGDTGRQVLHR